MTLRSRLFRRRDAGMELEAMIAARRRPTSFPFISGDTFRSMADVVFDETGEIGQWREGGRAFCATKYVPLLCDRADTPEYRAIAATMSVMVHNGDIVPGTSWYARLLGLFERVLSVNASAELEAMGVIPVPIGLENLHWNRNGVLANFDLPFEAGRQTPAAEREFPFSASFRTTSNPVERDPLRHKLVEAGGEWLEPGNDVQRYCELVRRSSFVLSPVGNGADCHRTWEAIYLGAIPVVVAGTLSPSLTDRLPILSVASWEEFLELGTAERRDIAAAIDARPRSAAFAPDWCSRY